jgi:peptidoglycan LD-endopeptidase CwlK
MRDLFSTTRLAQVNPALVAIIEQMDATLSAENILIRVVQGLRTWAEQDALFAQGRTAPGSIVTNAKGGESWHNFGCAVDLTPSVNRTDAKFAPDWNEKHPAWQRIVSLGESLGLTSGKSWGDMPHLQLTGRFPYNKPDSETLQLFKDGGVQAIWAEIKTAKA